MNLRHYIDEELALLLEAVSASESALTINEVAKNVQLDISDKTLQRRLKRLVSEGKITTEGSGRGLKYKASENSLIKSSKPEDLISEPAVMTGNIIFSQESLRKLERLDTPSFARDKVSYDTSLVEKYVPNTTRFVSPELSSRLVEMGKRFNSKLAAGTYAKDIAQRLLIDLSYNSSRLEGNTYSILDTEKLLEIGEVADGKMDEETIMLLNHKEAILFLIENAEELTISPFVIRNIHQLLSQDLLDEPYMSGQIREKEVKITMTSYLPVSGFQLLEELFTLLLRKASQITDPFEQSFFLLIHLSYLQAFIDVNKRTARLSCNLPFIKDNLCPLSFVDVPKDDYLRSLVYFYETGDHQPCLEVFMWAYERSSQQYTVVEKSMGKIDAYRIKYRAKRKEVIGRIIRDMVVGANIAIILEQFCLENKIENPDKFISIVTVELSKLHSGAILTLGVTESTFIDWQAKYKKSQEFK